VLPTQPSKRFDIEWRIVPDPRHRPVDGHHKDKKHSRAIRQQLTKRLIPCRHSLITRPCKIVHKHDRIFGLQLLAQQVRPVNEQGIKP